MAVINHLGSNKITAYTEEGQLCEMNWAAWEMLKIETLGKQKMRCYVGTVFLTKDMVGGSRPAPFVFWIVWGILMTLKFYECLNVTFTSSRETSQDVSTSEVVGQPQGK